MRNPSIEKNDQTYSDSLDKANVLNDHFSSVFTIDVSPADQNPTLEGRYYSDISKLQLETNGIRLLLQNLDSHKAYMVQMGWGIFHGTERNGTEVV